MKRKVRGSKCFKTFVIGATKNYPSTNVLYTLLQTTQYKSTHVLVLRIKSPKLGARHHLFFLLPKIIFLLHLKVHGSP